MTGEVELGQPDDLAPDSQAQDANTEPADNAGAENAPLSREIVSKIVDRERKKAYEKGRKEALMQNSGQDVTAGIDNQQPVQAPQAPQAPQMIGGMQQLSNADIERLIAERTPDILQQHLTKQMQQHKQETMINTFVSKMQAAEAKYPGLEDKLNELDYSTLVDHVIPMVNELDNTGDVMHELVNSPEKLSSLITLSYTQPRLAKKRLLDLSGSIKTNEQALAQEAQSRNPLSQIKPTVNSALPEAKELSVLDLQRMLSKRR